MDAAAFRATLAEFNLGQKEAGRFLDVAERTVRRWATGDQPVPRSVVLLFGLMRRYGLAPQDV